MVSVELKKRTHINNFIICEILNHRRRRRKKKLRQWFWFIIFTTNNYACEQNWNMINVYVFRMWKICQMQKECRIAVNNIETFVFFFCKFIYFNISHFVKLTEKNVCFHFFKSVFWFYLVVVVGLGDQCLGSDSSKNNFVFINVSSMMKIVECMLLVFTNEWSTSREKPKYFLH